MRAEFDPSSTVHPVLLHAYKKGFSAMQVAIMFSLYELAGVVTNLAAGLAGARWGIRCTLVCGLSLQLVSYGLLFGWRDEWAPVTAIIYVTIAQMFGGISKDLTKLGGKTVTKLVTPDEQSTRLFKIVSLLTGWKNSLKGVGYFAGSALINVSYELALCCMMALIGIALPFAVFGLQAGLGTTRKKNARWSDIFITHNPNLNWLSLARCFLFASRDFWFEVCVAPPPHASSRALPLAGLWPGETPLVALCSTPPRALCRAPCPAPCDAHYAALDAPRRAGCSSPRACSCTAFACVHASSQVPLPFFLRSPDCSGLGSAPCTSDSDCGGGAVCLLAAGGVANSSQVAGIGVCVNGNAGGGCGGFGWDRVTVGAILGAYIIVYGQVQSWTPQLVTGPLRQTPPNKLTEVLWGVVNCAPTALMACVALSSPTISSDELAIWLMGSVVAFALIFAVNSSIHSFLVVHYAKADKVATSVGFYYMSNACGRLLGTLGSGVLYTYAGTDRGPAAGSDGLYGLGACFVAGTLSSLLAALITVRIEDQQAGLRCGPCICVGASDAAEVSASSVQVEGGS